MKTMKLTGMLFVALLGTTACMQAATLSETTFNHVRGTGIVVVVNGLTQTEIHLKFEGVEKGKNQVIQATISSPNGSLFMDWTTMDTWLDIPANTFEKGHYIFAVEVSGIRKTIHFSVSGT